VGGGQSGVVLGLVIRVESIDRGRGCWLAVWANKLNAVEYG